VAEQTGLYLQLLPMLLGFFTYKGAVVAKQAAVLFADLASSARGGQPGADSAGGDGGDGAVEGGAPGADVASVDRAFRRRMLREV
jgi:ATP synthase protein I